MTSMTLTLTVTRELVDKEASPLWGLSRAALMQAGVPSTTPQRAVSFVSSTTWHQPAMTRRISTLWLPHRRAFSTESPTPGLHKLPETRSMLTRHADVTLFPSRHIGVSSHFSRVHSLHEPFSLHTTMHLSFPLLSRYEPPFSLPSLPQLLYTCKTRQYTQTLTAQPEVLHLSQTTVRL